MKLKLLHVHGAQAVGPRPVRAIRVTRGGLEPSAIAREFSGQALQVT